MGVEYDFLTWTSFPSSLKLVNDTTTIEYVWYKVAEGIPVKPGGKVTLECMGKQVGHFEKEKITGVRLDLMINGKWDPAGFMWLAFPQGTFDWKKISYPVSPKAVPEGATVMMVRLYAKGVKGDVAWFDDLKIYQDGVLIYSNSFDNWKPYLGAGLGAVAGGVGGYLATRKPEYALAALPVALVGGIVGRLIAKP